LQTLFPKSQALQFLEAILLRGAIYDGVPKKAFSHARNVYCGLDGSATTSVFWIWGFHCILELPSASALVMQQAWVVVALVEVFEDTGKNLGFLVGKVDPLTLSLEKLPPASRRKERRQTENVLVRCKKSSLATDRDGDDR
jgi:hypothetical protein